MEITRRHKRFGCVAAVCLMGLVGDRLWLSETPAGAEAAYSAEEYLPLENTGAADELWQGDGVAGVSIIRVSLADRFREIGDAEAFDVLAISDAFRPVASWMPTEVKATTSHGRVLTLNAVIGGAKPVAVINGQSMFIGQVHNDVRLVAVGQRSATVEADGRQIELQLSTGRADDAAEADVRDESKEAGKDSP